MNLYTDYCILNKALMELIIAYQEGAFDRIARLIKKKKLVGSINYQDDEGKTALIHAVINDDFDTITYLIKNGADPNLIDDDGQTALMYAATNGYPYTVRLLLENGADPNIKNEQDYDFTALFYAFHNLHINSEIIELLCKHPETDLDVVDSDGSTYLIYIKDHDTKKYVLQKINKIPHEFICFEIHKKTFSFFGYLLASNKVSATDLLNACIEVTKDFETFKDLCKIIHNSYSSIDMTDRYPFVIELIENNMISHAKHLLNTFHLDVSRKNHHGEDAMCLAIKNDYYDLVTILLNFPFQINNFLTLDKKNYLHVAAKYSDYKIFSYILDNCIVLDINVNGQDYLGYTPLMYVVENPKLRGFFDKFINRHDYNYDLVNDHKYIDEFIKRYTFDLNITNNDNHTCLSIAFSKKLPDVAKTIIKKGVDLGKDINDKTYLHYAAQAGDYNNFCNVLEYFVSKNLDINRQDNEGDTALHCAENADIVKSLHQVNCDILIKNRKGLNPVQTFAIKQKYDLVFIVDKTVEHIFPDPDGSVADLVREGFDINTESIFVDRRVVKFISPLTWAIINEKHALAKELIINGANYKLSVNYFIEYLKFSEEYSQNFRTLIKILKSLGIYFNEVLHILFDIFALREIEYMIDNGYNVDYPDSRGRTLLSKSVGTVFVDFVDYLISKGADLNRTDDTDSTPFLNSLRFESTERISYYISKGADINIGNPLTLLCTNNNKRVYNRYDHTINPFYDDRFGDTPNACNIETIDLLLDKGVEVDRRDDVGMTALMHACLSGHEQAVRHLILKNADVNIVSNNHMTALMFATIACSPTIIDILIREHADIDPLDPLDWTQNCFFLLLYSSVFLERSQNALDAFNILHEAGCGTYVIDDNGNNLSIIFNALYPVDTDIYVTTIRNTLSNFFELDSEVSDDDESSTSIKIEKPYGTDECSVCTNSYNKNILLIIPCLHTICTECYPKLCELSYDLKCSMCRATISQVVDINL